jgi:hypothetical protein
VHKTPTYDIKMLLRDFFDETVFVKFRISNIYKTLVKHIQYNQKSIGKSIPAYEFKKSQEKICEPKVSRFLPNVCDFQKEKQTLGYEFKNL